jgi:hypothetical protein
MYQMVVKYANIFHSNALQNIPKLELLVCKDTIWQPWVCLLRRHDCAVLVQKYLNKQSKLHKMSVL